MVKKVFGIYDGKACAFLQPLLFMNTPGEAIRMFESAVNDEKSMMNKYPQDFILFEIAEYDDNTGRFKSYDINKNLGCAIDYFKDKMLTSYPEPVSVAGNIPKKE